MAAPVCAQESARGYVSSDPDLRRRLDIGAGAVVLYDSNIARSSAARARARGLKKSDVRFTPSLTIDINRPFGRQSLFLSGLVGYDFHARNSRLDRERIGLNGGARSPLGPCDAGVDGGFTRQQSDLDDFDLGEIENTETITSVGFNASCGDAVGLRPIFGASQTWARNSAARRKISDYDSFSANAGIGYARPSFGQLSLFGAYSRTRYPRRLLPGSTQLDRYISYSGGVRYERSIGAKLKARASVAYSRVEPRLASEKRFGGLTYALNLTAQPTSRLQLRADLERAAKTSNRLDVTYYIERRAALAADYALGSRTTLSFGGSLRKRDYFGSGLVTGLGIQQDDTNSAFASLRFAPNRRLTFSIDALHQKRDATGTLFDYTSNRVGLTTRATF